MARHKDSNWILTDPVRDFDEVHAALLMDIRDELKRMNAVLHCPNFIAIPSVLRRISANTAKPRKKRETIDA